MDRVDKEYLHTLEAGAWLPWMQSVMTGFVLGLIALGLSYVMRARSPWSWAIVIGGLGWVLSWLVLQWHWFGLTRLESWSGLDLNHDGRIGDELHHEPVEVRVKVERVNDGGTYQELIYNLPGTIEQLTALAEGLLIGDMSLSERAWTGSGNPFSVSEFRSLRSELIRRGLVELASDKDARQGFILTVEGRECLSGFIEPTPSPTERVEVV